MSEPDTEECHEARDDDDTETVTASTYIPESQKAEWLRHPDEMDMSFSEFIRCMVQAGRRGFLTPPEDDLSEHRRLLRGVEDAIQALGPVTTEELDAAANGDGGAVTEAVEELRDKNLIRWAMDGGWIANDDTATSA